MNTTANNQTVNINLSQIKPSSNNHRKTFSDRNLSELAQSIKAQGVLQPIMVQATEDDMYEIVYGERRYRASLIAGLETIPTVVRENLTSSQSMEIALTENLQREDISPIEEYKVYEQLMEHNGYDIELLMARFSKSESYIRSRIRLSALIGEFKDSLTAEDINLVIALELCKYSKETQAEIYDSHYATTNSYQNWIGKRAKEVVEMLGNSYSTNLDDYFFGKSECYDCHFNSNTISLFGDEDNCGRCLNRGCLQNKNSQYITARAIDTHENNPELPLARGEYRYDEKAIEELTAKGYEVEIIDYCRECPEPPISPNVDDYETAEEYKDAMVEYEVECAEFNDETSKINEDYQKGAIKMYAYIGNRGVSLGYNNVSSSSSSSKAETPLTKLGNQDKRNAEIRDEKTIADIKELVKGFNPTDGDFTVLEERLTYFTMLKEVRKEHFNLMGVRIDGQYFLSDDDKVRIINNLTEEVKNVIRREFISSTFKDDFRDDLTAELLKEYAQQHAPEKMAEIEQKHIKVYEKRHLRIAEKIGAIAK